jgi:uncharacterized protein YvpB
MITLKRPTEAPHRPPAPEPNGDPAPPRPGRPSRLPAIALVFAILVPLLTIALVDVNGATDRQKSALALHEHWSYMRENGVPEADLEPLERQWDRTQASRFFGSASVFWLPGAQQAVDRWQQESDAIWSRDIATSRSEALVAEQTLHDVLGPESYLERKARMDAVQAAITPKDFASLRDGWDLEARLVPLDRTIAARVAGVQAQALGAGKLGVKSDPATDMLAQAAAYTQLSDPERFARSTALTGDLTSLQGDLQARLGAATLASQNFQRTSNQISIASMYGIKVTSYLQRVADSRSKYASSLTATGFNVVTQDLKQIYVEADRAIYLVLQQTRIIRGVPMIFQNHPLSCEEAATSMALAHQGIHVSQDQILREIGADRRPMYVDGAGRVRWGNPYRTFVGNVNGSESNYTGFGTFYPPLVRVARAHGARILGYGTMSAATIYARLLAGHPVVVFSTWDWRWHPRHDYLSFDGRWIPWIGPAISSHVYTAVGVSPTRVLINDPIRGQYWVSKAAFEAGYSDFREAIVFL